MTPSDLTRLDAQLHFLQLHHIQRHYQTFANKAAEQQRSHLDYLAQLVKGEATMRESRSIERRIKNARFPVLKSLDDFQWNWPKRSTARKSRTCSVSASSQAKPTSC
jgi:DNA replication protein DnaC